jgi:hypothetical protein
MMKTRQKQARGRKMGADTAEILTDKAFMRSLREALAEEAAGRLIPWTEVKTRLGDAIEHHSLPA